MKKTGKPFVFILMNYLWLQNETVISHIYVADIFSFYFPEAIEWKRLPF